MVISSLTQAKSNMKKDEQTLPITNDWSLTDDHGYILNRDRSHAAATRLNLQFFLWKECLGYNIHPSILPRLSPGASIADVATGSAIWLTQVATKDVARECQLHGFDIDPGQAPQKPWLPTNVTIRHLDLLNDELPIELHGQFDYIHTRLLLLVVQSGDPRPVMRNLWKMLKPGGYLQWDELDTLNASVQRLDSNVSTPSLDQLLEWSQANGRHDWTTRLADSATDIGFVEATTDFVGTRVDLLRAFNDQHLLTAEEFAEGLAKLGQRDAASKYFSLIEGAYDESRNGAALDVPRLVCVARKPIK